MLIVAYFIGDLVYDGFGIERKINHKEHVHHINGNRSDNRMENLFLVNISDHNILEKPKQVSGWKRNSKGRWT